MVRVSAGSTPAATDSISTAEGSGRDRLGVPPAVEAATAAAAVEDTANGNVDVAVAVTVEGGVNIFMSAPCSPPREPNAKRQGRARRGRVSFSILRALLACPTGRGGGANMRCVTAADPRSTGRDGRTPREEAGGFKIYSNAPKFRLENISIFANVKISLSCLPSSTMCNVSHNVDPLISIPA